MSRTFKRRTRLLSSLAAITLLVAACGAGKPAYCSSVSNLKDSIKALPSTNVLQNGISALNTAATKVQSDAKQVVSDAKTDFPQESSALTSSIDSLTSTVKQLQGTSPTPAALTRLTAEVVSVVNSAQQFTKATSSKCG